MRNRKIFESLINRKIKRLISEAAYATEFGKTVGSEGLKYLNDGNSLLSKALRHIPWVSNKVKEVCIKLQNGQIDLSVLDKATSGTITLVAIAYALVLTPMLNQKNVKNFANADTKIVKDIINKKFGKTPAPVIDCILQIQSILKSGGVRRDPAEYGKDVSQAAKSGISLHHMR